MDGGVTAAYWYGELAPNRLDENLGALAVDLTAGDLQEIDEAASKITLHGARRPESVLKMTGL
jgi:aryl-alcohol dehydrogenase-like predicted oxidoreductase